MSELNRRHNYGLDLFLLSVDEGITGYRDDSLETVKRNEIQVSELGQMSMSFDIWIHIFVNLVQFSILIILLSWHPCLAPYILDTEHLINL